MYNLTTKYNHDNVAQTEKQSREGIFFNLKQNLQVNILKMTDSTETIQEIAYKLMLEQNKNDKILNGPTERTTFVLGSKGVVS